MRSDLLLLVLFVAACGPDVSPQPATQPPAADQTAKPPSFAHINETLQKSCSFSACHSPHGMLASAGLDLSQDVWLSLVNVTPRNDRAKAEGMKLVKPCDPEHSFLFLKLTMSDTTEASGTYGGHMPAANVPLSADELALIHDWIARGARLAEPAGATGTTCAY